MLNYPSKGARGRLLKSYKRKLDEKISEPPFLADSSHRVKFVSKHIFSMVNKSKAQQCGCTKADSIRIKKDLGYMIKNNRGGKLKS